MVTNFTDWNGRNHLKHYGVVGMKWGVRKDRRSEKNLDKAFRAESKKLDRLTRKADLDVQRKEYSINKNKAIKAGKTAVGSLAAAVGSDVGLSLLARDPRSHTIYSFGPAPGKVSKTRGSLAGLADTLGTATFAANAVAAVSSGMAVYYGAKAVMNKRRMSEAGHNKAVSKAKKQAEQMIATFGDTKYAESIGKAS